MSITITNSKIKAIGGLLVVTFQINPAGSYTTGGTGDVIDLTSIPGLPTNALPDFVEINSMPTSPNAGSGWEYQFVKGATQKTCGFQVFGQSGNQGSASQLTELGSGAYAASITGDVIIAFAIWVATFGS